MLCLESSSLSCAVLANALATSSHGMPQVRCQKNWVVPGAPCMNSLAFKNAQSHQHKKTLMVFGCIWLVDLEMAAYTKWSCHGTATRFSGLSLNFKVDRQRCNWEISAFVPCSLLRYYYQYFKKLLTFFGLRLRCTTSALHKVMHNLDIGLLLCHRT